MIRVPPHVAGLLAALLTPWWIRSGRYRDLLAPSVHAARPATARSAVTTAERTIRLLAHARMLGGPWRSTCLTRSVAACLALRASGVPAVVRLGATRGESGIAAHAWVESTRGDVLAGAREGHTPLSAVAT